ncbi:Sad1/UNC-like, C-terminal [Cynara cardunculus var. scolymus]|uniref:Sad1/UNC-like, C-terminal n=1 Tax=Cynara cardunculus var. scolymus TaxID=59895 RepID=A0A124R4I0_CYNCS|nr:Sad1/UNC-like, C-terminal [Cynara cardunculus var. scolymus]
MPYSKTERLRSATLDLDEFKNKAFTSSTKNQASNGKIRTIIHRLEPNGAEYNYASASKGTNILGHNKEAKGSSNILSSDKNKYLRKRCSFDKKFVVLELSKETLIDTEIANFEHHSWNPKGFELFGSMSHFGSDFCCTLSVLRVYGVDVVERMLEDLVIARKNKFLYEEDDSVRKPDEFRVEPETEPELEPWLEEFNTNRAGDVEIGERDVIVKEIGNDLRDLHKCNDIVTKHVDDMVSRKSMCLFNSIISFGTMPFSG